MTLVLVRVDCRLIHGQVLEAWAPYTQADTLVVANDQAAADPFQQTIMTMAVPPHLDVAVMTVKEAAHSLQDGQWARKRIILLVADIQDALACHQAGLDFDSVNLGNLFCTPGKDQITDCVCLDERDLSQLNEIKERGVEVEARPVPESQSRTLSELIENRRFS